MAFIALLSVLLLAPFVAAQTDNSKVLAVFLLGRHGDRTSRIAGLGVEGEAVLTTLGKNQVFSTGGYWRNKYLNSSSSDFILGVNDNFQYDQVYGSAPCRLCRSMYLTAGTMMSWVRR
jgi:hypothetical protein